MTSCSVSKINHGDASVVNILCLNFCSAELGCVCVWASFGVLVCLFVLCLFTTTFLVVEKK